VVSLERAGSEKRPFQPIFHLAAGIMMALFYAFILEPVLPPGAAFKGWLYAIAVWIMNAAVIFAVSGEGFAGCAHISLAGIIWYAGAHTLFFLVLAYGFAWLTRGSAAKTHG
jgi:hypothetical protein